jgi:hypothetical protein
MFTMVDSQKEKARTGRAFPGERAQTGYRMPPVNGVVGGLITIWGPFSLSTTKS